MKYFITLLALAAFASCDTKKNYQCECTSNKGQVVYTYDAEYEKASDGVSPCTMSGDSIARVYPNAQVHCQFYIDN